MSRWTEEEICRRCGVGVEHHTGKDLECPNKPEKPHHHHTWPLGMVDVLRLVARERVRQVHSYGLNEGLQAGTGPDVRWLARTDVNLDLRTGSEIEAAFRADYEDYEKRHGAPTWMHLIREEVGEAFKENDSVALAEELVQVAALCVSMVERIHSGEVKGLDQ